VAQPGAILEVADVKLADGMAAMVDVQADRAALAVGDKGVVAPVGPQAGLRAEQAGTAHDQPVASKGGLGDLGDAAVGVVDVGPGVLGDGGDGPADGGVWRTVTENRMRWRLQAASTLADQNPESARNTSWPLAPARRTRPASSLTNRSAPRPDAARPVRIRTCSTSPVSALVASNGC
jgi:hypothetical protein